jgi:putative NADPH-quinone reductase
MKTLVIAAHPELSRSHVHKRWLLELAKHQDEVTIHELYAHYPDGKIDVKHEQQLVESHDTLIFQFPLQWFSVPSLLKQWFDEVLVENWGYGTVNNKMKDRKIALAISAGIKEKHYRKEGRYQHTIDEILAPLKATFLYTRSRYVSHFVLFGAEESPGADYEFAPEVVEQSAGDYISFVRSR